jgi:ribosomal protein S18 acetylase RimI-like enzyme
MTIVRRAGPADLDLVIDIGVRSYRDHYASLWSANGLERYLGEQFDRDRVARELAGESVRYLVAFVAAQPVGFAKVIVDRAPLAKNGTAGLELQKIYFLGEQVSRGQGALLLRHVLALADELKQPLVWLDVLKSNERAIAFYERHGFVRVGESPFSTDVRDIGFWIMQRSLR